MKEYFYLQVKGTKSDGKFVTRTNKGKGLCFKALFSPEAIFTYEEIAERKNFYFSGHKFCIYCSRADTRPKSKEVFSLFSDDFVFRGTSNAELLDKIDQQLKEDDRSESDEQELGCQARAILQSAICITNEVGKNGQKEKGREAMIDYIEDLADSEEGDNDTVDWNVGGIDPVRLLLILKDAVPDIRRNEEAITNKLIRVCKDLTDLFHFASLMPNDMSPESGQIYARTVQHLLRKRADLKKRYTELILLERRLHTVLQDDESLYDALEALDHQHYNPRLRSELFADGRPVEEKLMNLSDLFSVSESELS